MSLTTLPTKRQQVINEITAKIREGRLMPGARLATVREMAAHFDVSLSVIQNALHELMNDGFVECRGASGFYVSQNTLGEAVSSSPEKIQKNTKSKILLTSVHHSDLVWHYTYAEYEKLREAQLKHLLKLADRHEQFHFAMEQAEILRVYLRDNPTDLKKFRALFESGRFEPLGGLCIPDLNLISGESIIRNLLAGRAFWKEIFGTPPDIACMSDAFGMCAQLPQMLVKCGFRYLLPGRMPNLPATISGNAPFRWVGLDNTEIPTAHNTAEITHLGHRCNLPLIREKTSQLAHSVALLRYLDGLSLVHYMTEESEIQEDLFWIVETVNREEGNLIEFGSNRDYFEAVPWQETPVFHGELNPVFTGCYTTRCSVKQTIRKAENLLFKAEFLNSAVPQIRDYAPLWHQLNLAQFHDAACGCHTDAANHDIMEKLLFVIDSAEANIPKPAGKRFSLCNFNNTSGKQLVRARFIPEGVPAQEENGEFLFEADLPACGLRSFRKSAAAPAKTKKGPATFETDFFEADFSTPEPVIRCKKGENVFSDDKFGEVLIRSDYGTMWAEQFTGFYEDEKYRKEKVTELREGPVFFKAVTEGEFLPSKPDSGNLGNHWPGFGSLSFRKEYIFPRHQDYFRLRVTLNWKGCNTKISIRFPLDLKLRETFETFEVPFGAILRKPYFEVTLAQEHALRELASDSDYRTAFGDWPALNWVNYSDTSKGLTVANRGTPGHQLVNGSILVSLIRSGTNIRDGCMVPQEGSFENGTRTFEFAFRPHAPGEMEKAAELGQILNRPPALCAASLPEGSLLSWSARNLQLSALRRADDGVLIRLYETIGRETSSALSGALVDGCAFFETDMEGHDPKPCRPDSIYFRPFEIKTFLIKKEKKA